MDKLPVMIIVAIIAIGLCTWVFLGDDGVNNALTDGYDNMKTDIRSYGYKPGP